MTTILLTSLSVAALAAIGSNATAASAASLICLSIRPVLLCVRECRRHIVTVRREDAGRISFPCGAFVTAGGRLGETRAARSALSRSCHAAGARRTDEFLRQGWQNLMARTPTLWRLAACFAATALTTAGAAGEPPTA